MRIEIIAIGDEVLRGETVENNAAWLGASLTAAGATPLRTTAIPDDEDTICSELFAASRRSDVVLVTGGLGPTVDDVTRQAAIKALGGGEEIREGIIEGIEKRFAEIGRRMPEGYRDLARVPRGAELLENRVGAAPGLALRAGGSILFLLPGVPAEMKDIFEREVLPRIRPPGALKRSTLRIYGLTETEVEDKLARVLDGGDMGRLSIISSPSGISVYLPAGLDPEMVGRAAGSLGDNLFGRGNDRLEEIVVAALREAKITLTVAESLTGGMLASMIVSVPGASGTFLEGHVTYSDESKIRVLGVDRASIISYGAVSEEVCRQMAEGARRISGADLALSTTGIAGPGGATREKAVGLCFMGLAGAAGTEVVRKQMAGDRGMIRLRASCICLDMIRRRLQAARPDDPGSPAGTGGAGV